MSDDLDIAVVSDDEISQYDGTYTVTNPLTRLFGELAECVGSVTICGPTTTTDAPSDGYSDPRVNFVERPFYSSVVDFLKKAPVILPETHRAIRHCIMDTDYLIIRIPSPVAAIAWFEAERQEIPYAVYVAGDLREVVVSGQKYTGIRSYLATVLAQIFHKINIRIARDRPVFVMGSELKRTFGDVSDTCVSLIPNLLSESDILPEREYTISPPVELLYCGRLAQVKGVDTLIRSAALLSERGVRTRLTIVGGGPLLDELMELSQSLDIEDVVRFEGHILFGDKLYEYYSNADIFVLGSRSEGIPKTILEAMGFRLPIIATDVGGIPDVITDDRTGLLVEPDSPEHLADQLEMLFKSRSLRARLGRNAAEFVKQHTITNQAETISQVVQQSHPQW